jgi:hypothetical protein
VQIPPHSQRGVILTPYIVKLKNLKNMLKNVAKVETMPIEESLHLPHYDRMVAEFEYGLKNDTSEFRGKLAKRLQRLQKMTTPQRVILNAKIAVLELRSDLRELDRLIASYNSANVTMNGLNKFYNLTGDTIFTECMNRIEKETRSIPKTIDHIVGRFDRRR